MDVFKSVTQSEEVVTAPHPLADRPRWAIHCPSVWGSEVTSTGIDLAKDTKMPASNFCFIMYTHPFIMYCSHKKLQLDMQTIKLTKKLLK